MHIGYGAEHCRVKQALMGFSVLSDDSGTVHREGHVESLNGDIVDKLVVAALKEAGIHRKNGTHSVGCHSSAEGDSVRLGNSDIKEASAVSGGEFTQ